MFNIFLISVVAIILIPLVAWLSGVILYISWNLVKGFKVIFNV